MFGCYNHRMQSETQLPPIDERRDAPRVDLGRRFSMRIDPCDGRAPIECALLDYSVTGVRLELPSDVNLPE
jgi:hypothetical protein